MLRTLTESEAWDLVDTCQHAHLGCHANGRTYVVPVSFARDGQRILGLTTVGMKIELMRANPDVCIQVEDIHSLTEWRSAILFGRFEELSGFERAEASRKLIDKYGPTFADLESAARRGREVTPPRLDGHVEPVIAYAIVVSEITGRSESETV